MPIIILDLQFRRDTVCTVLAGLARHSVVSVSAIRAVFTVRSICTVRSVASRCRNPVSVLIQNPLSVQCPAIDTVGILLQTHYRAVSVLSGSSVRTIGSVSAICAVRAVLAMIYCNRAALGERDGITYSHTAFH